MVLVSLVLLKVPSAAHVGEATRGVLGQLIGLAI